MIENKAILVSVIIPTKNRSIELQRAITSVLNQTIGDFEILVVDDKSDEDIKEVINGFDDARVKYILNNSALSNANVCRNIGLVHAKGKFTAMLDSDDEWLPKHLESKIEFIKQRNCSGVFGSAYVDNGHGRVLRLSRPRKKDEFMLDYLLTTGRAPTPTHVYDTSCAKQVGWDESLKRHQDYDFSARFAETFTFLACEEPTVVIHWAKGVSRSSDISSQEIFIRKNLDRISPNVLIKYLTAACAQWGESESKKAVDTVEYFKKLALKNIRFMSFADYQLMVPNVTTIDKIYYRLKYAISILVK